MKLPHDQVVELKSIFSHAGYCEEGGSPFIYIPELILPDGCTPDRVEALLCPTARDGYPSRLFFSAIVSGKKQPSWNSKDVRIIERNWFAYSFRVREGLRLAQLVAAHLGGLV